MSSSKNSPYELSNGTAIVCHDAGAANVIVAGLLQSPAQHWRACMQGPAAKIWEGAFGCAVPCSSVEEALDGASFLLSGTGWGSDLEYRARDLAQNSGIPSVAVLDHWVNYPQRFIRDGKKIWPDECWVTDEDALRIAEKTLPGLPMRLVPNFYLQQQLSEIKSPDPDTVPELLYIAEPVRSDWQRDRPGEFQALDYFTTRLHTLGLPQGLRIRLRPHPSDAPGKYDEWMNSQKRQPWILDESPTIAAALSKAPWAAGCESYGLVLALAAGRTVFCTLPPWAPPCRLPHQGLIHIAAHSE